jgi:ABC-type lipoprotein export system ATPase subunit
VDTAILMRRVIKVYPGITTGTAALQGLDLEIGRGEIAAVVGPSGSGKSSMLRILAGLERPSAGTVTILGQPIDSYDDQALASYRHQIVGIVEQHYWRSISPYLTAIQSIELPMALRQWAPPQRRRRAQELLARVGLAHRAGARPAELSGGEQQRIAFAAALAPRPALILADEPTGELDAVSAEAVLAVLRDLVESEGVTAVVVTHDSLVRSFTDRAYHLHDGRSIATSVGSGVELQPVTDASGWRSPLPVAARPPRIGPSAFDSEGPVVRLEHVARSYFRAGERVPVIANLSALIPARGVHSITGPSGSGKSTVLRMIAGLDRPSSGRIETLGRDLGQMNREALAALRAGPMSVMSQAPRFVPFLSAIETVELDLMVHEGIGDGGRRANLAAEALDRVRLGHRASASPETMSGGERARLALARALAPRPQLLVLDEPTAALDRKTAVEVIELLADIGMTTSVLVATHDRDLIAASNSELSLRFHAQ